MTPLHTSGPFDDELPEPTMPCGPYDDEPADDDATRTVKGILSAIGLSLPLWLVIGAAVWWAL